MDLASQLNDLRTRMFAAQAAHRANPNDFATASQASQAESMYNAANTQAYEEEKRRQMDEAAAYKMSQERSRAEWDEQFRRQQQVDAYRKQQSDPHGNAIRQMLK